MRPSVLDILRTIVLSDIQPNDEKQDASTVCAFSVNHDLHIYGANLTNPNMSTGVGDSGGTLNVYQFIIGVVSYLFEQPCATNMQR